MKPYQLGKEGDIVEEYEGLPITFKSTVGLPLYSAASHAYYSLDYSSIYSFKSDDSTNFPKYWEIDFHRIIYNVNCFHFDLNHATYTSSYENKLYYNSYNINEYKIFYSIDDEEFIELYHEIVGGLNTYKHRTINFGQLNLRSIRFVVYSIYNEIKDPSGTLPQINKFSLSQVKISQLINDKLIYDVNSDNILYLNLNNEFVSLSLSLNDLKNISSEDMNKYFKNSMTINNIDKLKELNKFRLIKLKEDD